MTGEWPALPAEPRPPEKIKEKAAEKGLEVTDDVIKRAVLDSIRALMMIRAYRIRGHLVADLDPLGMRDQTPHPELDPKSYGFTESDMDRPIFIDNVLGLQVASMRQILDIVQRTYCGTFALQYMHISDPEAIGVAEGTDRRLRQGDQVHAARAQGDPEQAGGGRGLREVPARQVHGHQALRPRRRRGADPGDGTGHQARRRAWPQGGRHRDAAPRPLSVLANVMGKPYRAIFNEFQGGSFKPEDVDGSGDVKYHLGASSDREFDGNSVHLSLTANPSHLEAVNPVVSARARQAGPYERHGAPAVLPVLLHGDAAFAGQGVVAEGFGLSGLRGHRTGGTMHIVVNNQIGFTTAPHFSRSSPYPTDIALMVEAPIFHVNGDDPEAVVPCRQGRHRVPPEIRQGRGHRHLLLPPLRSQRGRRADVHQPGDVQPDQAHKTTLQLYTDRLVKDGLIPEGEIEDMKAAFQSYLNDEFEAGKDFKPNKADWLDGRWSHLDKKGEEYQRGETAIKPETLRKSARPDHPPDGFKLHKTVGRLLETKKKMFETGEGFDWATAEALAFGSLLTEGYPVRLSGQDSTRGTFSQRHSSHLVDQETEERYYPLNHIREGQEHFEAIDSMLSEYAVLGFEYGYSLAEPNALVLWEAQFGDFANGAQIMFDQFISSGERKWLRMSGLVMLLPHGFEGQGPEHSSARLERFLQQCAEDNWIVANCTTPANYFHILRRQIHREFRKPLVLMTPKSLLRHKLAVSSPRK